MPKARHRFQVGPSTYTARQRPGGGWWVHEVWWEATKHHDEEDMEEWWGPYDQATAKAKAAEWSER